MENHRLSTESGILAGKMRTKEIIIILLLSFGFFSCSKRISDAIVTKEGVYDIPSRTDSLNIHFLGTASFCIDYNGRAVLTDPFVSNPPLRKVLFGKIYPSDTAIINDFIAADELERVEMVAIGHGHYDHLLDLPHMIKSIAPSAKIIGSATSNHIIAPVCANHERITADQFCASVNKTGLWIYSFDSMIRVMPVLADHPPHLMGITLYGGKYDEDLKTLPRKTKGWKMGEPIAYLIDYLNEDSSIGYRIFLQSSGSEYPLGFFPEEILEGRAVDVALLSIATDSPFEKFPDRIISLMQPKVIFLAHWENFWRDKYKPVKTVQKGNPKKLFLHLQEKFGVEAAIILPHPGGRFKIY